MNCKEQPHQEIDGWTLTLNRWIDRSGIEILNTSNPKEYLSHVYTILRKGDLEERFHMFSLYYKMLIFYQTETLKEDVDKVVDALYVECLMLLKNKSDLDKTEGSAIWEVLNSDYDVPLGRVLENH